MHRSSISAFALTRAREMLNPVLPELDPRRTAHVVIDLQNAFVVPGSPSEIPTCRAIIPNVNRISRVLRSAGGTNVFLRFTVDEHEPAHWASMRRRVRPEALERLSGVFRAGTDTHQLWSGLDIASPDVVLDKTRFSALTPGTCGLQKVLEQKGVDTVIITGTQTNCCCEATARDAMQLGYSVLFVEDGCCTHDDATHNNTLSNLCAFGYADICPTDAVIHRLPARTAR